MNLFYLIQCNLFVMDGSNEIGFKSQWDWQYIRVPLIKHSRDTKIEKIQIDNEQAWKQKIISQLQHYKILHQIISL